MEDDLLFGAALHKYVLISIHVPRVEDDENEEDKGVTVFPFQSTSPGWRTTKGQCD